MKKSGKIMKQSQAYKGYAGTYNVRILNSFNLELQLINPESVIKNKLTVLLTELGGFKFVTILVIEFKEQKLMM